MNKIQLLILVALNFAACENDNNDYNLKTLFPSTVNQKIDENGDSNIEILIEDQYYIFDADYMKIKSQLISYQTRKVNENINKLKIEIVKGDTILYNQTLDSEQINSNYELFENNDTYLEVCKIIFRDFDNSEIWNWSSAISQLSDYQENIENGGKGLFDLLFLYSVECKLEQSRDKVMASDFLKEGLRLINSAGMRDFWNAEKKINQDNLLSKANKIFTLCDKSVIKKTEILNIKDGVYTIQREKEN